MDQLGRDDEFAVPQPATRVNHRVLDDSALVIEDDIINLAQLFIFEAIKFGAAQVVCLVRKLEIMKRAVVSHAVLLPTYLRCARQSACWRAYCRIAELQNCRIAELRNWTTGEIHHRATEDCEVRFLNLDFGPSDASRRFQR